LPAGRGELLHGAFDVAARQVLLQCVGFQRGRVGVELQLG